MLASLVGQLMTTETNRLEAAHNGGAPFPPAPDGAHGRTLTNVGQRNHSYFLPDAVYLRTKDFNNGQPFPPAPARARGIDPEASRRQGEVMASLWKAQRDRTQQD